MSYDYKTSNGVYDVDINGNDRFGIYRGQAVNPNEVKKYKYDSVGGKLSFWCVAIFAIFILFAGSFENNWVSYLIIAVILLFCIILTSILRKKFYPSFLPLFLTILISVGLIGVVIYYGIASGDGNFSKLRNNSITVEKP